MKRQFFGTDGVRGTYGGPVMNEEFATRLGFAAATWLTQSGGPSAHATKVLIGRDTRWSGSALEAAVARGLRTVGAVPASLGVVPTPAVARAVRSGHAALGVVITASHNPAADNGIKFFGHDGVKLSDDDELAIEALLPDAASVASSGADSNQQAAGARPPETPQAAAAERAAAEYIAAATALLPAGALRGWKIVVDTANGATVGTTPTALRSLGADVVAIGDAPNGRNINDGVGSEHPEQLAARVVGAGARLGIAHDGDGDRVVLCDERGGVLDGDEILTLLALHALQRGTLVKNTLVVTVQSNLGVDAALAAAGGRVLRTAVGDRYVSERLIAEGVTLGGESSGHVICGEISPTGDGLVAALKVIEVMAATGKPLSELRRALTKFPQATAALTVREKRPVAELARVAATIQKLESELGARGRVLVRWSGTEPKLRLLVEGSTEEIVRDGIARLDAAARADLSVV